MDERSDGHKSVMEANASYIPRKPPWYAVMAANTTTSAGGRVHGIHPATRMGVEVLDRLSSTDLIKRGIWGDSPSLK